MDLVRLTNEELSQTCDDEHERVELLNAQTAEVDNRLAMSVLYNLRLPRYQSLLPKKKTRGGDNGAMEKLRVAFPAGPCC